jgi:hypothetical protein
MMSDLIQATVGRNIRKALEAAGVSVTSAARELSVHRDTLYKWLRGENGVPPAKRKQLAALLCVDEREFYAMDTNDDAAYQQALDDIIAVVLALGQGEDGRAAATSRGLRPVAAAEIAAIGAQVREALTAALGPGWERRPDLEAVLEELTRAVLAQRASPAPGG